MESRGSLAIYVLFLSVFSRTFEWANGQSNIIEKNFAEGQPRLSSVHLFDSSSGDVFSFYRPQDEFATSTSPLRLFHISEIGHVTSTQPLTYTIGKSNKYDLTVLQRARGETEGGIARTLRITVTDTNNFQPIFQISDAGYEGFVKEGVSSGSIVRGLERCHAVDRDTSGVNKYRIISGNERNYFSVENKPVGSRKFLVLKTTSIPIVRDERNPYIVLTVQAIDGGNPALSRTAKIRVTIEDANDQTPIFDESQYTTTIAENTPVMKSVLRVRATDKDIGTNGGIYYYMNPLSSFFTVDAITGVIRVVRTLDYTSISVHTLNVYARDRGPSPKTSSKTTVTIRLGEDVAGYPPPRSPNPGQNTKPYFPQSRYPFSVREDFPVRGALLVVRAADNDPFGPNKRVTYGLSGTGQSKFHIDPESGVVTLKARVDYETTPNNKIYTLTVTATDQGSTPMRASTQLLIEIQDVDENRNPPVFNPEQKVVNVQEDVALRTLVATVRATDGDGSGPDGTVVYSIEDGTGLGVFEVNSNTGEVRTFAALDREKIPLYDLVIKASDNATFPRSTRLYLMINVVDVDDNFPYFTQPMYISKVPENMPKGTFVTAVSARDPDVDSTPQYSLVSARVPFKLDSITGVLRTDKVLDQSDSSNREFELVVEVISQGKKSVGQVNITVSSKVNKPPAFKNLPYNVKVPENLGAVPNLLCIAAVDSHSRPVQYSISSGGNSLFGINSASGKLHTTKSFDYEDIYRYNLRIEATTSSSREIASTPVSIEVTEERDAPRFDKSSYKITIPENTAPSSTLTPGLLIYDADTSGDQFICSLEKITSLKTLEDFEVVQSQDRCRLVTKSGAKLDTFKARRYQFEVRATDRNYRNMFATAKVEVIVTDVNNHSPEFSKESYWISVPSSKPSGSILLTVAAVDKDTGTNSDVRYELVRGQASERFQITDGNKISSASSLTANVRYQLQVKASDTASSPRSSNVNVYVSVYAASESPIVFQSSKYTKAIRESAAKNTLIFTVAAKKSGSSAGMRYELVGGYKQNGVAMFSIDSSGRVLLISPLDREITSSFTLAIRAKHSGGAIELATDVEGVVTVTDENDNKPKFAFEGSSKIVTVDNYSPSGTVVITAKALDPDEGSYGVVKYSFDTAKSTSNLPFNINELTGVITAKKEILYTDGSTYTAIVKATDGGSSSTSYSINVQVVNSPKPPRFKPRQFNFTITETKSVGDQVNSIRADYSKPNAFLKYSFVSGNRDNAFCVNGAGMITVARSLDREKIPSYRLRARVELGNSFDEATVYVILDDINDDPPHFSKKMYDLSVRENQGAGVILSPAVSAIDHDFGPNGEVTYEVLQSVYIKSKDLFSINQKSGVISVRTRLDYEKSSKHILYVKAKDNGTPRLSAIAQVNIAVIDINDNSPVFAAAFYRAKVSLGATKDTSVIQVRATDLDSSSNGEIEYSIIGGNDEGAFKINVQGVISVKKSLTTVAADKFKLTVQAQDKGKVPNRGSVTVEINVFLPDGPPRFIVSPVVVDVKEGVPVNHRVAGVKAATSEALTYTILSGNEARMFRINPSTGQLDATRTLDYEEAKRYELQIEARDTRDRSALVKLIINVLNINDNKPTFVDEVDGQIDRKAIGVCGPTNIEEGQVVTRLGAVDKDKGDKITYEVPDNVKKYFEVDPRGVLIAKKPIKELPKVFKFGIKAKDNGKPPQENSVDVRLVFVHYRPDQQSVRVKVREDAKVGSVIARVPRYLPNGTMFLLFPEKANFSVEANGDVRLLSPLDFETKAFHLITVREKASSGSLTNDLDVEITVLDVNDNSPRFTTRQSLGRVNTNSRAGANVYQLDAKDDDGGSSGLVGYQLESPATLSRRKRRSLPQTPFTINPKTRRIEVAGSLEDKRYDLRLYAFDYGIPRLTSDVITLSIDGSVAGQRSPRFTKVHYYFNVSEDAHYLTFVGQVKARSISGARLGYTIIRGNTGDKFIIMQDGRILLNSLLDFERNQAVFHLKIQATEQIPKGLSSVVDVSINVINANDHFPYFDQQFYSDTVAEDAGVGKIVRTVTAHDCDCVTACSCSPGVLKYSINPSKEQGGKFFIDPVTGQISVSVALDYETQKHHLLKVYASDTGKKTYRGLCFVNVTITNANDNSPVFTESSYKFRIAEGAGRGIPIAAVVAQDADGDRVTYSKPSGSALFQVDSTTGVITLGSTLGSKTQYTLQVKATDQGGRSSAVPVTISVVDSNDHVPRFTKCRTPPGSIQENLPSNYRITQVTATDADRGKYGQVQYSIEGISSQSLFKIDSQTGEVRSLTSLDREAQSSYTVIIKVEDGTAAQQPEERLLWYCFLKINVADVNDNRPYFSEASYFGSVHNQAPNGTKILTVQATDNDIGTNSNVKYTLVKSAGGLFTIDPSTGVLKTNANLRSYTTLKKFVLEVAARDVQPRAGDQPGQPTRYSAEINIVVSNQQPPRFTKETYTQTIKENVITGYKVTQIKATSSTGSKIIYKAVKANPKADELFRVDPQTGVIKTGSQLDFETGLPRYEMQFMAVDKTSQLYSTCKVIITIEDVNDVTPSFVLGLNTKARVLENKPANTEVIKMEALDKDTGLGGQVTYGMKINADFKIDQNTGMITTKRKLDRETKGLYDVVVFARDTGGLQEDATVFITVVDQNDMAPVFKPRQYRKNVPEDSPKGKTILDLYAKDGDIGDNAKLTYFISGGDPMGKFSVKTTPGKGALVVNGKLDFESVKSYTLEVKATDGQNSDKAVVVITVDDVNDLPPIFSQPLYESRIQENTGPSTAVVKVTATDLDGPTITFKLGERGKGYFKISTNRVSNSETYVGDIQTGNTKLDREASPIKVFTVIATDGKHETKAEVKVNLTDVNDNSPRFPSSPYIGYVQENKPAGTSVMYIQAVDDDDPFTGGNAKVTYELTDSAGSKFKIHPKTGLITTLAIFDREKAPNKFNVRVKATDAGNPRRSGSIDGTIYISDANDHKPKFTERFFRGTVPENAPPGYSVTAVSATDDDVGANAVFEFVVVNGNDPHAFYVDPYNGTVLVSGILDYEKKKEYTMTLTVADRGMPPLKSDTVAYVVIKVTDANDNAPVFIPKEYNRTVRENVPVGTPIVRVTAVDRDSGPYGNFTFAIADGNLDDIFVIKPDPKNASIGIVTNRLPLDRETIPVHHLKVTATDVGGLQGGGDIWITLDDVNDNGPWFLPPYFVGRIKENTNARQFVATLKAYDPDTYIKDQTITFTIQNGTRDGNFKLDTASFTSDSAKMYSFGSFDREDQISWTVGVSAVDSGKPKQTNFTYVYVDVEDVNDKEPFSGELLIIVNAYGGKFIGGVIGKAYYKDDDFEGDVNTYTMESQTPGTHYKVNKITGDITAPKDIPMGEYNLKITVREGSTNDPRKNDVNFPKTVTSTVKVLVRKIDPIAVNNSVAVQFLSMRKVGYFVDGYYDSFLRVLAGALGVSQNDIKIFSVQKATDRNVPAVNVFFAVSVGKGGYMSPLDITNKIVNTRKALQDVGLVIGALGIDECAKEKQKVGKCTNVVERSSAVSVASGDYGQVPAPDSSLTIVSMDVFLKAQYTHIFIPNRKCKPHNPCLHGGKCFSTVPECPGFVCKCPRGYNGPLCEMTTRTFYGNSYIWLPKLTAYSLSEIEFDFITKTANGLLMYQGPVKKGANNGAKDFLAVVLKEGRVEVYMSLGLTPVIIKMDKGPRLDDGEWHTLQLSRNVKVVEVIIDRCSHAVLHHESDGTVVEGREICHVYGRILGRSVYLDGFGPLQIGGVSDPSMDYPDIPYKGFKGCIRNVKDNNRMYDMENPLRVVNAPKGCQLATPCPDCKGHGYCEPLLAPHKSVCVCDVGHAGANCDGRGKASYYLENSFTRYLIRTSRRKRRQLVPPPTSIFNKFYTSIAMQVKVNPDASDVVIFLASNRMGTEFQRVEVKNHKLRYVIRLGNRMLVLTFPQLNITDGIYHTVVVRRQGNRAVMQLDFDGYIVGNTRGARTLLDMGGGSIFAGGLPNVTLVRVIEAIMMYDGNAIVTGSGGKLVGFGTGLGLSFGHGFQGGLITVGSSGGVRVQEASEAAGSFSSLQGLLSDYGVASDSAGTAALARSVRGVDVRDLHVSNEEEQSWSSQRRSKRAASTVSVLGDFGGCIAGSNVNGADIESHPSIKVERQNVVKGCPCVQNHCLNGGTCVNAQPPYCICPPGWTGVRCEIVVTEPNPGTRPGSRWMNPAVIAMILVVLLAVMIIMAAVILKRRKEPVVVFADSEDAGHVHDNVRLYHDDGGGEEDNQGYDITKLMKYTYIEATIPPISTAPDPRANEGLISVGDDKPLLQGAPPPGPVFGLTGTTDPGPRMPKYVDGDDVGDFITTRVKITDREVFLAVDELHIYRYEGDDMDVDDLSEIEDDEDEEFEQEFDFLSQWGSKFDRLAKMYEDADED